MTIAKGPTPNHEERIGPLVLIEHRRYTEVRFMFGIETNKLLLRVSNIELARAWARRALGR